MQHSGRKKKFTLLVSESQKSNFPSGLEIIQGGALRPWEYPEAILDVSEAQNCAKK